MNSIIVQSNISSVPNLWSFKHFTFVPKLWSSRNKDAINDIFLFVPLQKPKGYKKIGL
jgi:hypothetical protein